MKIVKDSITVLAGEGWLTLQVPSLALRWPGEPDVEYEDAPDEWFVEVRIGSSSKHELCVGKERGFPHLSRKGWEANKGKLAAAFAGASFKRGTWADFEKHADEFFSELEETRQRRIKAAQDKIKQLEAKVI